MFKNLTKKRMTVLLVSLSLILVVGVGVTLAYVFASTGDVVNTFTPSHVSCAVVEKNNGATETTEEDAGVIDNLTAKSAVQIKNTGDTEAYIRAAIIVTWKNADGTVYAQKPVWGTDYELTIGSSWACSAADGYYYYTYAVAPTKETPELIVSCKPLKAAPQDGYSLSVEIVASAIQSTPDSVVKEMWGATASNGTITAIPGVKVSTDTEVTQ